MPLFIGEVHIADTAFCITSCVVRVDEKQHASDDDRAAVRRITLPPLKAILS